MYVSSDPGPDYGKIRVLTLPKQISILGPVQVQNQIESNPVVSQRPVAAALGRLLGGHGQPADAARRRRAALRGADLRAGLGWHGVPDVAQGGDGLRRPGGVRLVRGGVDAGVRAASPTPSPSPDVRPQSLPGPTPNPEIRALVAQAQKAYTDAQAALKNPNGPDWAAYGDGAGPAADRAHPAGQRFGAGDDGESVAFGLRRRPRRRPRTSEPGAVEPGAGQPGALAPSPGQTSAGAGCGHALGRVRRAGGGDGARGFGGRRAGGRRCGLLPRPPQRRVCLRSGVPRLGFGAGRAVRAGGDVGPAGRGPGVSPALAIVSGAVRPGFATALRRPMTYAGGHRRGVEQLGSSLGS